VNIGSIPVLAANKSVAQDASGLCSVSFA
jgi:hypothetical protein